MRKNVTDLDDQGPPWYRTTRYLIAFISFFGMFNTFLQRADLSMAIVCMVNHTAVDMMSRRTMDVHTNLIFVNKSSSIEQNINTTSTSSGNASFIDNAVSKNSSDETLSLYKLNSSDIKNDVHVPPAQRCTHNLMNTETTEREDGELVWDKETQGLTLGALFWGYVGFQFVCAFIIRRWGPRLVVGSGMLFMSVCTLLTPVIAIWSPWALFVLRVFVGVFSAFTVPGLYAIWGQWAPPGERSRLIAISFSGNMTATALVFPVSAFLCKLSAAGGWPLIFYIYGGMGVCWTILWMYSVYDDPAHHPRVHPKESEFLKRALGATKTDRSISTPWLKIFTSLPYLSIICAHFTFNWALFLMMANLPIYMREVMHFDIKSNGLYSFLPFLVMVVFIALSSVSADALIGRQLLSVPRTRKLMTIIGHFIPSLLLVALSYLDCTRSQEAVALLTLAIGLGGFAFSGTLVNFYDIAPMFAAPMMTISNAISGIPGILAPYVVAEVTKDKTREQWQIVFFLTSGLLVFGTVMHVVFGKGHVQPWAVVRHQTDETIALPSS